MRPASETVRPRDGAGPRRWAWFLHGIFGRGRNWRSVARRLVEDVPSVAGRLVDLRLHGASTEAAPPHTLKACVGDLAELAEARDVERPEVLLGHSFGGKVALEAGRRRPPGFDRLEQIWVVDASPSAREPGGDAVRMLEVLRSETGPFDERADAVEALVSHGFSVRVGQWMATNLEKGEEGLRWGLDLEGVGSLLEDFFRTDAWEVVERPPADLELHLVVARGSDAVGDDDVRRIEEAAGRHGRVHVHRLAGDHMLNVSNPDGLLEVMRGRIDT